MPLILGTNSIKDTGFDVANSCRFNSADSAYMHKTPSGAGNSKTMTLSAWVKLSQSISQVRLFDAGGTAISFSGGSGNEGQFMIYENDGTERPYIGLSPLLRDYSAWYHVVVAIDTTQASSSNRVKFYINGEQITSYYQNTVPNQDETLRFNTTIQHNVGASQNPHQYFDGYIAEFCWIDGTQYAASDFGEFDEDSPTIWKPKDVSGLTFGTNGFYLDFEDSSNLGNDANGGTDLTEVNLAAVDQSTDTPTNNFATLNPLIYESSSNTFAEGNLKITGGGSDSWTTHYGLSTIAVSSGKWFVEAKVTTTQTSQGILGIISTSQNITSSLKDNGVATVEKSGRITGGGSNLQTSLTAWSNGDIAGLAFDATNGTAQFYRNGSAYGSAVSSIASDTYYFATTTYQAGGVVEFNFGSPAYSESGGNSDGNGYGNFSGSVPSGYYSLNTKNLAEYG